MIIAGTMIYLNLKKGKLYWSYNWHYKIRHFNGTLSKSMWVFPCHKSIHILPIFI